MEEGKAGVSRWPISRRRFAQLTVGVAGLAAASGVAGLVSACGGGSQPQASGGGEAPGLAAAGDAGRKEELKKLVKAATGEGELSVWDTIITPETWDVMAKDFKSYWGLPDGFNAHYTSLTSAGFVTKANEELSAGRVTMDVGGSASIVWLNDLVTKGKILEYHSPEIEAAYSRIFDMKLAQKRFYTSNVYYFIPMWNPDVVKKPIRSWWDLDDRTFGGGKIIMGDASLSESYTLVYVALRTVLPEDYFRKIAVLKPAFKVKSQDIAQDVASGEHPVAFSGQPSRALQLADKGVNLELVFPKEGTVLIPQATFMPSQAPHPNAAKLFVEYFLSERGQQLYVKHEGVSSGREGFNSPVPKYAPAIEKVKAVPMDWTKVTPEQFAQGRKDWSVVFKGGQ
jgi:iron(III) transport system substrate-binding protein